MMSDKEFKQKCKEKKIYYSIELWNAYVDKCWSKIEESLDKSNEGVYNKSN